MADLSCLLVSYSALSLFNYHKWFKSFKRSRRGCFFKYMRNPVRIKSQQFSGQNEQKSDSSHSNLFKFVGDTLYTKMKNPNLVIFFYFDHFWLFFDIYITKNHQFFQKWTFFKIQTSKNDQKWPKSKKSTKIGFFILV